MKKQTLNLKTIQEKLDEAVFRYNRIEFIETDPISIPHQFQKKQDIEISAFLTALISWGRRDSIIKSAKYLLSLMDHDPYNFILNFKSKEWKLFRHFKHRTFNGEDAVFFLNKLNKIYTQYPSLEKYFFLNEKSINQNIFELLKNFKERMFLNKTIHAKKHISDPSSGSACKRLNMFLRWMIRSDKQSVDFGIWNSKLMPMLMIPLDIHVASKSRELGILTRKQNDWKSVEELTEVLRTFDSLDPVKYDFALFGLNLST